MDPNSSNEHHAIHAAVRSCAAGADLILSAFSAAVNHYKRASVALPFPSESFTSSVTGEKSFEEVQRAIEGVPAMHALSSSSAGALSEPSSRLLGWLLAPSSPTSTAGRRCPRSLRHIGMEEFVQQIRKRHGPSTKISVPPPGTHHQAPDFIFENRALCSPATALEGVASPELFRRSILAWHGTSFERLHSIISTGLQPASGTRLQRNGANHGGGIYLSTDYGVAWSFCETEWDGG